MISLTTNVCIVWKRFILMIAFIGAVILGASVSHAAYIAPPSTVGEAVVLIDADTKEILFAKNPDKWMHPASTTKMVTLLTALELKGTQLDELATISSYATSMEESNLGVHVGDQITLEGVLEGMMVASGNDAAVVVAENVSGSVENFAKDMNRVAAKAGAKNSVFLNPHGLTQMGHHSTARDLAMIAAYGMKYQMFRDNRWDEAVQFLDYGFKLRGVI